MKTERRWMDRPKQVKFVAAGDSRKLPVDVAIATLLRIMIPPRVPGHHQVSAFRPHILDLLSHADLLREVKNLRVDLRNPSWHSPICLGC